MSEQKPIPSGMLSNPQILGAIITGIVSVSYTHLTLPTNREV